MTTARDRDDRSRPAPRCPRGPLAGLVLAAALAASPRLARADPPVTMTVPDLVGARALAMGAYRGVVPGNDGIFTNAAALAAVRRYSVEGQFLMDRLDGGTALQGFDVSIVDSTAESVTAGFAYTRLTIGTWTGSLFHVPIAVPLGSDLFLGVTPKYQSLDGPAGDSMRAFNADVSMFARLSRMVGLGVAGYNLLSSGHHHVQPKAVGVGLSAGDEDGLWRVAFDWRGDFDRQDRLTSLLAAGAEVTLADLVPVRAGFEKDDTRNANFWSAGVGIATSSGFGLDVSYRQRIESPSEYTVAAGLKLLVPGV